MFIQLVQLNAKEYFYCDTALKGAAASIALLFGASGLDEPAAPLSCKNGTSRRN